MEKQIFIYKSRNIKELSKILSNNNEVKTGNFYHIMNASFSMVYKIRFGGASE